MVVSSKVEQVSAGVQELLPAFRERAQDTEDMRSIPDVSMKMLAETGFFKLMQPKRYGGLEADPVAFYTAVRDISSACGSTGWVAGILGVHPWVVALFDDRAQQEVWGEDTDVRIASSFAPMGKSEKVAGGYRLSGRWKYSSGADHCTWVLLGGPAFHEGKPVDFCTYLVPVSDYKIVDVWDTVGLRGTGSNDIVVEDVFVPEHRAVSFAAMGRCEVPGQAVNEGPLYRMPFGSVQPMVIGTPAVGMALGAYDAHVEYQRQRVRDAYLGERSIEDPFAMVRIAEAATEIDAAWLQLTGNIGQIWDLAQRSAPIPLELRMKHRRDQVRATERAIFAIDRLFNNSGAHVLRQGNPIQRFWRDVHAARAHAANDPERVYKAYGAVEFGTYDGSGIF
ncbi:3-hydroxy-9,10-secoandrosta-1,3,5(10)-triene-9,17-dione monooxygenase oxygenase subunit [Nocardia heshunensis]